MSSTDNRIVQMQFDNKQFESGVKQTMNSLDKLEDSLQLNGATKGMEKVSSESQELCRSMNQLDSAVQTVKIQFSALQIAGAVAMSKLTLAAIDVGKKINNAIFGQIVSGGAARSQNIEHAKFQLEGLGVAWNDIKDDINYGVEDTAYGLDEAAKIASQLVTSYDLTNGYTKEMSDEMQVNLRAISGVAAMTNSSYSEIGDIFATISANGRLMTMQVRQFATKGLPILAELAKQFGVTQAEMQEMVTKGKISFREFADAMDEAYGKHAKESNQTFTGAFANAKAALSRIGQKFADPIYENLRKSLVAIKPAINSVNTALTPIYQLVENFTGVLSGFVIELVESEDFLDGLKNVCMALWSYLRPIKYALQELGILSSTNAAGIAATFKELTSHLEISGEKVTKVKNAIKAIINVFRILSFTVVGVINAISPIFTGLADAMGLVWKRSDNIFDLINNNYSTIIRTIAGLSDFVRLNLADYIGRAIKIAKTINWGNLIVSIMSITRLMSYALEIGGFIANLASTVIAYLINNLPNIQNILSDIVGLIVAGGAAIGGFFSNLFGAGSTTVSADINNESFNEATKVVSEVEETFDDLKEKSGTVEKNFNDAADAAEESGKRSSRAMKGAAKDYEDAGDSVDEYRRKIQELHQVTNEYSKDSKAAAEAEIKNAKDELKAKNQGEDIKKKLSGDPGLIENDKQLNAINMFFETILDRLGVGSYNVRAAFYTTGEILWSGYEFLRSGITKIFTFLSDLIYALSQPLGLITFAIQYKDVMIMLMRVLEIIFAVKIWQNIYAIFDIIPSIVNGLKSIYISKLAAAVSAFLLGFSAFLLALGGFFVLIAYATRIVDMEVLKEFYEMIHGFIIYWRFIIGVLIGLTLLFDIGYVLKGIAAMEGNMKAFSINLASFTEVILGVGLILLTFVATMYFIYSLGDDADKVIAKAAKVFIGFIIGITIFIAILTALVNTMGELKTCTTMTKGFLKAFNMERTVSPLAEIATVLTAMIGIILAIALAFKLMDSISPKQLIASGIAIAAVFSGIAIVIAAMLSAAEGLDTTQIMVVAKIVPALWAMAGIIIAISAAMYIIGKIEVSGSGDMWTRIVLPVIAILGMLAAFWIVLTGFSRLFLSSMNLADTVTSMAIVIGSLGALVLLIAGSMWIMDQVSNIESAVKNLGLILLYLFVFVGLIEFILGVGQAVSKENNLGMDVNKFAILFASLGAMLLMMSAAALIASNVDWHGLAILSVEAVLIVAFIAAIELICSKMNGLGKYSMNIAEVVILLAMITVMFTALAAVTVMLQNVNWDEMIKSVPYILAATIFVGVVMGLCAALAGIVNNPGQILTIGLTLGLICAMFLSMAYLFNVLGSINWDEMEKAKPILLGAAIFFGALAAMMTTLVIIGSVCPATIAAMAAISAVIFAIAAVIGAIALVIVGLGFTAMLISTAIGSIAESFQKFSEVDFDTVEDAIDSIADFMGTIADLSLKMPMALIGLALMSVGLWLTAQALTVMSLISPEMVDTAMNGLELLMERLKELFSGDNSAVIAEGMLIGVGLALLAMLLGVGITVLAAGILAGSIMLLLAAVVWNLAGEFIFQGMVAFVDNMVALAPILMDSFKEMMITLGLLALFGIMLTIGGAAILAGSLVLTVASLFLLAGSAMLSLAVDLLEKGLDSKRIQKLMLGSVLMMAFCVELVLVSTILSVTAVTLMVGAGLFMGGAAILNAGAGIFEKAIHKIKEATEDILEIQENMKQAGENIVAGLVEGIEASEPLAEQAMFNLATFTCFGTFANALGIHSPSEELRAAGHNIIAGLVEGLEDDHMEVAQTIADIANAIPPIFGNSGEESGNSFGDSISNALDGCKDWIGEKMSSLGSLWGADMGNAFGGQMTDAINGVGSLLDQAAASWKETLTSYAHAYDMQTGQSDTSAFAYENLPDFMQENIRKAEDSTVIASGGEFQLPTEEEWEDYEWNKLMGDSYTYGGGGGGSTSTEDLTEGLGGGSGSSSDLADSIASNSGAGTGINDLSQGGTNINSNNTYNFTQNNYSPKELDRTELYEQTNYQLKRWYGWMQSNA